MSTLTQHLALLETRGLLRVTVEHPRPVVRFKHALTREATYNSMLHARRAELHRAAAETLSDLYPQPDLEMVLTIAEHWQRGGQDAAALGTALPHAQSLIHTGRGSSLTALLARLDRGNLLPTQQRDLDLTLGDAGGARGEYEPARGHYERALSLADTPALQMRALHGIGVSEYHLGNFARVLEIQQAHLELAKREKNLVQKSRALSGLGAAYTGTGELDRAIECFESSRDVSLQAGQLQELATAEANLAVALYKSGKFREAIAAAEHALELDEKNGTLVYNARTASLLGASYFGMQDLARAEHYYRRALESSRALDDQLGMAAGLTNLAELYGTRGEPDLAADTFRQAIPLLQTLKQEVILCFALTQMAEIQRRQAERAVGAEASADLLKEASKHIEHALEIAERLKLADSINQASEIRDAIHAASFTGAQAKGA
jgi:tetratricopeptide (TPR) repeat protein